MCTRSDKLYCALALAQGYDSIQIAQSHTSRTPELVLCTGGCATAPVAGSCPPAQLRRAEPVDGNVSISGEYVPKGFPDRMCECNETLPGLNCGHVEGGVLLTQPQPDACPRPAPELERLLSPSTCASGPAREVLLLMWHVGCESGYYRSCTRCDTLGVI